MKELSCDKKRDPVNRMIRNLTAAEFVAWLVEYHGLPHHAAETVEMNLREQLKWQRLQGRLDRRPAISVIAQIFRLRSSVNRLDRQRNADKRIISELMADDPDLTIAEDEALIRDAGHG